tara:strand:+ start:2815 stop:3099 length:285 start_codon:yes stop_codon:yes gene_type:complete
MIDLNKKKQSISSISNSTLFNAKEEAIEASKEHRYLQHQMFMFCVHFIDLMAKNHKENRYDGRNEFACEMARDMVDSYQNSKSELNYKFTEYNK